MRLNLNSHMWPSATAWLPPAISVLWLLCTSCSLSSLFPLLPSVMTGCSPIFPGSLFFSFFVVVRLIGVTRINKSSIGSKCAILQGIVSVSRHVLTSQSQSPFRHRTQRGFSDPQAERRSFSEDAAYPGIALVVFVVSGGLCVSVPHRPRAPWEQGLCGIYHCVPSTVPGTHGLALSERMGCFTRGLCPFPGHC